MSTKVRTTIIGAMAASLLAVTAIPAAAIVPVKHGGHGHSGIAVASLPIHGHGHRHGVAVASLPIHGHGHRHGVAVASLPIHGHGHGHGHGGIVAAAAGVPVKHGPHGPGGGGGGGCLIPSQSCK
jgi:hypothetical protein